MNIVLFKKEDIQRPLPLQDERAHHIIKILHKNVGDSFDAGIIHGQAGKARITAIDESAISFTFAPESDGKPLTPLIMIIGFPRPIQLKRLFRDMASLGVCEIHLAGTELGEKSYMQSTMFKSGAAYKTLLDGASQAKSTHVPDLFLHDTLMDCVCFLLRNLDFIYSPKIALDNVAPTTSLQEFLQTTNMNAPETAMLQTDEELTHHVYAAIGSERGWTDNERALFQRANFIRCGMGERILRTETAATAAASIMLSHMGEL